MASITPQRHAAGLGRTRVLLAGLVLLVAPLPALAQQTRTPPGERLRPATGADAMRPCPEYGPGFVRTPGSSVCIKLNGQVRGETILRQRRSSLEPSQASRVTAGLRLEARSQSDFGPVRAVVDTRQRRAPGDPLR